jgi:hypothetical protein
VTAYCIDRGLRVPVVGDEYLMQTGGILIPMQPPNIDPLQRFQVIQ